MLVRSGGSALGRGVREATAGAVDMDSAILTPDDSVTDRHNETSQRTVAERIDLVAHNYFDSTRALYAGLRTEGTRSVCEQLTCARSIH